MAMPRQACPQGRRVLRYRQVRLTESATKTGRNATQLLSSMKLKGSMSCVTVLAKTSQTVSRQTPAITEAMASPGWSFMANTGAGGDRRFNPP